MKQIKKTEFDSYNKFIINEQQPDWEELKKFMERVDNFQKESEKVNFIVGSSYTDT